MATSSVFDHANGKSHVVLKDESGRVLRMRASKALKSLTHPTQDEMESFSRSSEQTARERRRADRVSSILDFWAALLPQRIVHEELADFIEDINRRIEQGQRFRVYLRTVAAIFWTGVNTIGYFKSKVGQQKAGSKGH